MTVPFRGQYMTKVGWPTLWPKLINESRSGVTHFFSGRSLSFSFGRETHFGRQARARCLTEALRVERYIGRRHWKAGVLGPAVEGAATVGLVFQ